MPVHRISADAVRGHVIGADAVSSTRTTMTCPSAPVAGSSSLLGIIGPSGRVVYTPGGPRLTDALRLGLGEGDIRLDARYRFSGACVENDCELWQEDSCIAVAAAHREYDEVVSADGGVLPACGIRDTCRWWAQEGPSACSVCPFVVTSTRN